MSARACIFDLCVRRGAHSIHLDSSGVEWVSIDGEPVGAIPVLAIADQPTQPVAIVIPLVEVLTEQRRCCMPDCRHMAMIRCQCGQETCGCNACLVGHYEAHALACGVSESLSRSWAMGIVSGRPGAGVGRT